jgi:hypothetical protein
MDLVQTLTTFSQDDLIWLFRPDQEALAQAVSAQCLIAGFILGTHYPDGYLKPGLLVAKYDSGANDGKWGAYVEDDTVGEGLGTADGVILSGGRVRRDEFTGLAIATDTVCAVIPAGLALQVIVANMPGLLLEDGTTANPVEVADLPTGFLAMDDYA